MRQLLLLALVVPCGCSSPNTIESAPTPQTVRVVGGGAGSVSMGMSASTTDVRAVTLPASADAAWRMLPAAYESLAIPLSVVDADTRVAGNSGFNVRRRLGTIPLVRLVDCGSTQGGPSAETYDVRLTVTSQLRDAGNGTSTLSSAVEAMGKPVAFAGDYVRCSSTGVLEARIAEAVKARLAK